MKPELLAKYSRPVPRYTSYPAASHFGPQVDASRYGRWLEARGEVGPLSLYAHIPFCRSLCWFCGCATKVVNHDAPVDRYLDLLVEEIALVAARLAARPAVCHVQLGGGTPTILSARDLERLAEALRHHFDVMPDAEFAVEIDPRVFTEAQAAALARMGVNRASLGVQDFAPKVQKAINRIQTYEVTARVVDILRAEGIDRINLDLMHGLPYQTVEGVLATVDRALSLAPDRLTIFGYAHVPWMKRHQRLIPEDALPGPAERLTQASAAAARLSERGYVAIGIDHFAKPEDALTEALWAGRLRRNFQGYTSDQGVSLLGFGASAIGALPQGYVQNSADPSTYAAAIKRGDLATVRGIALSDDDRLRREIIERLMCDFAAPLDALCRSYGRDAADLEAERDGLQPMIEDEMVVLDEGWLRVTEAGRPLVRTVCAVFDRYLGANGGRHSTAL
jgi:oxygen-independent coproporphyrinogen-3 oxidase